MPARRLHSRFLYLLSPTRASAAVLSLACIGLIGQLFDIQLFKVIVAGMPAMSLATVICLMLLSAALYIASRSNDSVCRRPVVIAITSTVAVLGIINFTAFLLNLSKETVLAYFGLSPDNHVLYMSSPYTVTSLILLAFSMNLQTCAKSDQTIRRGQYFAAGALTILFFVSMGYLLTVPILFRTSSEIGMALHTLTALFLLCIGTLNLHQNVGLPEFYYNPRMGSEMLRGILPGMGLLLISLSILAEVSRLSDHSVISLLVVGTFIVATYELWQTAIRMNLIEKELIEEHQRFQALFDGNPDAVVVTDERGYIVNLNHQATILTGYTREQLLGNLPEMLVPAAMRSRHVRQRESFHANPHHRPIGAGLDLRILRADGSECTVDIAIRPVTIGTEKLNILSIRDLTDIKTMKKQIEELDHGAHHDPLTHLPNRRLLKNLLAQVINMAEREKYMVAICYCDLDGFKAINDSYGHQTGDALLVEAANRMKGTVRNEDIVARLGGDEFVVILSQTPKKEGATTTVKKLIANLAQPYELDGKTCTVTASVGISLYPHDGTAANTLLAKADDAMYFAKKNGKNQYRFVD